MESKRRVSKVAKVTKKNKIDLIPYGYQGEGVVVPGLTPIRVIESSTNKDDERNKALDSVFNLPRTSSTPITVIETSTNKDDERKKALESVFNLPRTSLSNLLPPETDTEKNIVKEFVNVTPVKLTKKMEDPFTVDRPPGSGPVDVNVKDLNEQLDFGNDNSEEFDGLIMDIDEEESHGGKRRHRKMKTKKAVRRSKRGRKHSSLRKTKTKRRRTFLRRK
uniref:Uncharacterized protein n=1 Tax=viral metagenome TaxID=1070528 RepID=A0A6C0HA94_9ZZZZ